MLSIQIHLTILGKRLHLLTRPLLLVHQAISTFFLLYSIISF